MAKAPTTGKSIAPAKPAVHVIRMPLNAVRVFEAVAAEGSFSAAAEVLHVTTAAVSMQIKSLEGYLNVQLFRRNRRDVQLTAEGEALLPYVRRGLDELELGFRSLKSMQGNSLVVTTISSFLQRWLLKRLPTFHQAHPAIDLQLRASIALVDFAKEDVHAAIRCGRGMWPGLHVEPLMDEWLVPACAPALLRKYGKLRGPGDTANYPLIHSSSEPWSVWLTGNDDGTESWPVSGTAFDDSVAVINAAEQEQGLALVRWTLAAPSIEAGRLVLPHTGAVQPARKYYFVCPPAFLANAKVNDFRRWLLAAAAATPKLPWVAVP